MRAGIYAGIASSGADVSVRLGKIEIAGTVMDGSDDVKNDMSLYSYGLSDAKIEKAMIRQKAAALSLRFHPLNGSFFFGLSAGTTESTGDLLISSNLDSSIMISEKYKTNRTITGISVGNHWTPGGVIIGCEWFGLVAGSKVKTQTESSSSGTENSDMTSERRNFDRSYDDIATKNTSSGLILSLGFMLGV